MAGPDDDRVEHGATHYRHRGRSGSTTQLTLPGGILEHTSTPRYNCAKCPAYCCTYPRTAVTDADIKRLAKGLGKPVAFVREKYTKQVGGERVLRHKHDEIFATCCKFLDVETRQCTVYEHRPRICRSFPGTVRCGYYDFLTFERRAQDDPDYIALT